VQGIPQTSNLKSRTQNMKIICVGRNYAKHIEELQSQKPTEPVIFIKPDSAILLNQHPFVIPEFSQEIHHEIEVIVKINKVGKHIDVKFAHKYYDGISVGIDFTARDVQNELKSKGLPWDIAKSFDGSAVIGEFISKKQFNSLENISFELTNNNRTVQKGNTSNMLWNIDQLIAHISQYFTLKIGDIIFTGTPEGVAVVKSDDVLEGFLEGNKLFSIKIK
jgi:2-keto-4-pentenoate hydratase/2-oxohepta-3-ene-1,7-dioic acid hydratase in catechol pathway